MHSTHAPQQVDTQTNNCHLKKFKETDKGRATVRQQHESECTLYANAKQFCLMEVNRGSGNYKLFTTSTPSINSGGRVSKFFCMGLTRKPSQISTRGNSHFLRPLAKTYGVTLRTSAPKTKQASTYLRNRLT